MNSPLWICKKNEIVAHIRRMFKHYGEDEAFFDEYLACVLEHDIDKALECFRDLVKQLPKLPPEGMTHEQRLQGMHTRTAYQTKTRKFYSAYRRRT